MKQLWDATDPVWAAIAVQATGACYVYDNVEFPPGATPARGRIGIEIHAEHALLLVDRCCYEGPSGPVAEWLTTGTRTFVSITRLREWVCGELRDAFRRTPTRTRTLHDVVDLDAVHRAVDQTKAGDDVVEAGELYAELAMKIRGQDPALRTVADHVARHLARRASRRPCSIMLLGPSGVGKTCTVGALAEKLASRRPDVGFVQIDLSEYSEAHRVSALLGAPPGYVGHGGPVPLLETLRTEPASIVLFDEFDKAHPDIGQVLMQALDRGCLGSGTGETVDCRAAIFVFCANTGSDAFFDEIATRVDRDALAVDRACRNQLLAADVTPALIGRIGLCVAFARLDARARAEIITIGIVKIAAEYGVDVISIDPTVVAALVATRGREALGARIDEHRIDHDLGEAFINAARDHRGQPVRVCAGPPPHCDPMHVGDYGPDEGNA